MAGERILIIDDEALVAESVREMLLFDDYEVDVAHDGNAAEGQLHRAIYDAAIIDLNNAWDKRPECARTMSRNRSSNRRSGADRLWNHRCGDEGI